MDTLYIASSLKSRVNFNNSHRQRRRNHCGSMYHYLALANLPIRGKDRHLGRTTIAPKGVMTGFSRDHPMSPDPLYSVQLYIYILYIS